jgi:hypothetical protein
VEPQQMMSQWEEQESVMLLGKVSDYLEKNKTGTKLLILYQDNVNGIKINVNRKACN